MAKGWTQARVAALAEMGPQDYAAVESGRRPAWPKWRRNISLALGKPEDVLFAPDTEDGAR